MYYEERVIDGILQYRTASDGAFEPCSQRALTMMLLTARGRIEELEKETA